MQATIAADDLAGILSCQDDGQVVVAQVGSSIARWRDGEWTRLLEDVHTGGSLLGGEGASFITTGKRLGVVDLDGRVAWAVDHWFRNTYTYVIADARTSRWYAQLHATGGRVASGTWGQEAEAPIAMRIEGPVLPSPSGALLLSAGWMGVAVANPSDGTVQRISNEYQAEGCWGDNDRMIAFTEEAENNRWQLVRFNVRKNSKVWATGLPDEPVGIVRIQDAWVVATRTSIVKVDDKGRTSALDSEKPVVGRYGDHTLAQCGPRSVALNVDGGVQIIHVP